MTILTAYEIRVKLNANGYSVGLAYELLLALREANLENNNAAKMGLQSLALEMYGLTPNKSKNDAKVLRAIANDIHSYDPLSTRSRMLEADVLVDRVIENYDSKDSAVDAFISLLELQKTYKKRFFLTKLLGSETRALGNRITALKAKLSNRFGNELVQDILANRIQVNDISNLLPNLPNSIENVVEKRIAKEINLDETDKASKTIKQGAKENPEPKIVEEPKPEPKKTEAPKPEPKKTIVPEGLDLTEEEYLLYLKSEQDLKEFFPEQQIVNPLFAGVKEAFYPVFDKKKDNYAEYCNVLLNRVVDVQLNEKNLEYVLLATYNVDQLNEIKDFINHSPNKEDLEYLVRPLNYKISSLTDNSPADMILNDIPIHMEAYQKFIISDVSNNYYKSIQYALDKSITSYEAFSSNPEVMFYDVTTNKPVDNRLDAMEKYNTAKENPSMTTKEIAVVGKDSLFIPLPPMHHQSSDNGCWSCSLQAQLNHFGVDLNQSDIRALRPSYDTNDTSKNPLVTLRNRISFSYVANRDEMIAMVDYSEIIHKTVKNSIVHHAEISNNFVDNIKSLLDTYKTPISCTNGAHYLTFIGYDGDKLIYQDSANTNPVKHQEGISPEMSEKYKDYCVGDCSQYAANIQARGMELTWVERYKDKAELKDMITNNHMDYNNSIIRGTSSSCFNKIENADDPFNYMNTNIIISNEDAKELGLGAFQKQNIPIPVEENEAKENIIENQKDDDDFCLLK